MTDKLKPKFKHDCTACEHLETVHMQDRWLDLYFCGGTMSGGSVIARFGDEGPDYSSYPLDVWKSVRLDHAGMLGTTARFVRTNAQREAAIEYAYSLVLKRQEPEELRRAGIVINNPEAAPR